MLPVAMPTSISFFFSRSLEYSSPNLPSHTTSSVNTFAILANAAFNFPNGCKFPSSSSSQLPMSSQNFIYTGMGANVKQNFRSTFSNGVRAPIVKIRNGGGPTSTH
jgi:hypothetical protein